MTEVCNDVQLEPDLQPLTGEQLTYTTANVEDGARLDIAANGFWSGRYERTFIDVRIFNPHAPSNRNSDLATCYRKHERSKKRAYEQRVREVEHASFTPLVLSASGGMAREATNFYKNLASKLAMKWNQSYSTTISWLHCHLAFFAITIRHPVYPRLPLKPGPCLQNPATNRSSHFCLPSLT